MKLLKNVEPVDHWRENLTKFWSNRFALLSAISAGAAAGIYVFSDHLKPTVFFSLCILFNVLAVVFRMFKQKNVKRKNNDCEESSY